LTMDRMEHRIRELVSTMISRMGALALLSELLLSVVIGRPRNTLTDESGSSGGRNGEMACEYVAPWRSPPLAPPCSHHAAAPQTRMGGGHRVALRLAAEHAEVRLTERVSAALRTSRVFPPPKVLICAGGASSKHCADWLDQRGAPKGLGGRAVAPPSWQSSQARNCLPQMCRGSARRSARMHHRQRHHRGPGPSLCPWLSKSTQPQNRYIRCANPATFASPT